MDTEVSPELVARFRAEIERAGLSDQRFGLAVSGGPDSLAMLVLAQAAYPGQFECATVDHGLRSESAGEAAFVAELCQEIGVSHAVLNVQVPSGNLQHEARMVRYQALGDWVAERELSALLTAHHADDQVETLLLRLNRGSGLSGLAGVRAEGTNPVSGGRVVRPMLGWRKTELEQILQECGINPVRDPSNEDERFDRARIRKALSQSNWIDPLSVAQSSAWLDQADSALRHFAEVEWRTCVKEGASELRYTPEPASPREIRLRVLARAIEEMGGAPRLSQVADLLDKLERGERANLAGVLVRVAGNDWVFETEPARS